MMQERTVVEGITAEDLFFAWVLRLDMDCNVADAARREIARLEEGALFDERSLRLRGLLLQAASLMALPPRSRRRHLH